MQLTGSLLLSVFRNIRYLILLVVLAHSFTHETNAQFDRDWKIFAIPFSHTDVGYTDTVPRVLQQHHEYLDNVISYIEQTQDRDPNTRFKWTVEIPWPLETYIESRPAEQIGKFMEYVRSGDIEIGAMHFGLQTDLCGPEELVRSLYYAKELQHRYDIPLRTVLINDTPGFTWSLAQILNRSNIPYLSVAMNSFLSEFFQTTNLPYLFNWEAQNGDRTLVWRSIHDQWAYLEGIIAYQMYGSYSNMKSRLTSLLLRLQDEGYPYDAILINAATGDNGPPRLEILHNAARWNDEHDNATITIATVSEFFDYVTDTYEDQIPVYSGDAPNWWSWHFASSAAGGFQLSRDVQMKLPEAETFAAVADATIRGYTYPDDELRRAYIENLLYEDHNLGVASATDAAGNREFWTRKMGWITSAFETSVDIKDNALQTISEQIHTDGYPAVVVFNPTAWSRSEAVYVSFDDPVIASAGYFDIVDESTGANIDFQVLSDNTLVFHAEDIPSVGYAVFYIKSREQAFPGPEKNDHLRLENDYYIIEIDQSSGGIVSLFDKDLSKELTKQNGAFNQYLHNSTHPPYGMEITENDSGAVISRVVMRGDAPGSGWYETEIVLYNKVKRIDFLNRYYKHSPTALEAVDFAYHFDIPGAVLDYEIPFGHVRLFDDELSGFRINHYAMQRWMNISSASDNTNIILASDAAAIQAYPSGQFDGNGRILVSFNSAGTSYRAGTGPLSVNFSLTSNSNTFSPSASTEFAYNFNQPVTAVVIPASNGGMYSESRYSFMTISPGSLLATTVKKPMTGNGYIIRLFNPEPAPLDAVISFPYPVRDAYYTTMLEDNDTQVSITGDGLFVPFNGFDIKTLRVILDAPTHYAAAKKMPSSYELSGNYPNPFNPSTNIRFYLPVEAAVRLIVHNILGQEIATIAHGDFAAGSHTVIWDGKTGNGIPAPSGMYFYRIEAKGVDGSMFNDVQSMVLIK